MVKKGKNKLSQAEKRKRFEATDVYKRTELKKIRTTGYEAFRVSPRTTTKYGKKYRKIYGATIEPDYQRPIAKKRSGMKIFGAKVKWYPHYYTKDTIKGGTRLIQQLKYYPVDLRETKSKLMLKKRKPVKKRKKK